MTTVYLVEDVKNAPGRVYALFSNEEDAQLFSKTIDQANLYVETEVVARTVWQGQPRIRGYNT